VNIFMGGSVVAVCAVVMVSDFHCFVKNDSKDYERKIIIINFIRSISGKLKLNTVVPLCTNAVYTRGWTTFLHDM
jgi:hypothetical protein